MFGAKKRSKFFNALSGSGFKNIDEEFVNVLNDLDSVYCFSGDLIKALQVWVTALAKVSEAGRDVAALLNSFYENEDVRLTQLLKSYANHYEEKIVNFKTKKLVEMVQNKWLPSLAQYQNNLLAQFEEMVKERHEKQKASEHYLVKVEKLKAVDLANRAKGKIPTQKDRDKLARNQEKLDGAKDAYDSLREQVNLKLKHAYHHRFEFLDDRCKDFIKTDFFFHDSVARSLSLYKDGISACLQQPIHNLNKSSNASVPPRENEPTKDQPQAKTQEDEFAAFANFGETASVGKGEDFFSATASSSDAPSDPFTQSASSAASDPFNLGGEKAGLSSDPFNLGGSSSPVQNSPSTSDPFNLQEAAAPPDPFVIGPPQTESDPFNIDPPQPTQTASDPFNIEAPNPTQTKSDPFNIDSPSSKSDPFDINAAPRAVSDPFNLDPPKPAEAKSDPFPIQATPIESSKSDPFQQGGSSDFDPFQTTTSETSGPSKGITNSDDPFSIAAPAPGREKRKSEPKTIEDPMDAFGIAPAPPAKERKRKEPTIADPMDAFAIGPAPPAKERKRKEPEILLGSSDIFSFGALTVKDKKENTETQTSSGDIFSFGALPAKEKKEIAGVNEGDLFSISPPAEPTSSDPFSLSDFSAKPTDAPAKLDDPFANIAIPGIQDPEPKKDVFSFGEEKKLNPFASVTPKTDEKKQNDLFSFGALGESKSSAKTDFFSKKEVKQEPFQISTESPFGDTAMQPPARKDDPFAGLGFGSTATDAPPKPSKPKSTNPFERFGSIDASAEETSKNPFKSPQTSTNPFF